MKCLWFQALSVSWTWVLQFTKLLPLLHSTTFSSQKHTWKTIAKCRNNTRCRASNNLIRLKNTAPETQSKTFTWQLLPSVSMSDHWTEQTLHKDLEVPSSGFPLLQMLTSSPARRQDMGGHLEGKHPEFSTLSFCNRTSQTKRQQHWALSVASPYSLDMAPFFPSEDWMTEKVLFCCLFDLAQVFTPFLRKTSHQ